MNEPNQVNTRDVGQAYGKVINVVRKMGVENTLLVEGNYWGGIHGQITTKEGTGGGTNHDIFRPACDSEGWEYEDDVDMAPAQIILDELMRANPDGLGDWKYDLHQYVDINSTGIHGCLNEHNSHVSTLEDMRFFTNFVAFEDWAKKNNVRAFVSEFGAELGGPLTGKPDPECNTKLNLFIQMLEESDIIDGWTIWRTSPATGWVDPKEESWTNSIIFGPLDPSTEANIATWKPLYENDQAFTDPASTKFCMPQLWNLRGASSKDIDFSQFTQ